MMGSRLVVGTILLAVASASVGDAARRIAGRLWPDDLSAQVTGAFVLGITAVVVLLEILGTASLLQPAAVVVGSVALWIAARQLASRLGPHIVAPRAARWRFTDGVSGAMAGIAVLLLALLVLGVLLYSVIRPRPQFDATAFHLPVAVQWLQRGNTRFLPYASPVSLTTRSPGNAELLALWLLIPTKRDFLVQLAGVPSLGLILAGTYSLARTLRARPVVAAAAALAFPILPRALSELIGTNMQDLLLVGGVVGATAFAARQIREPSYANVVAAGLASGLAIGARYAALISLIPVAALPFLPALIRNRPGWRTSRAVGSFGLSAIVSGSYFYIRNMLITGSPIYPQSVPWKHIEATEKINFPLFRSYAQLGWAPRDWSTALRLIWRLDGPVALLLVASAMVPVVLVTLRRDRNGVRLAWALMPPLVVAAFVATPAGAGFFFHGHLVERLQAANLRYGVFVLPLSAAMVAAELGRIRQVVGHVVVMVVAGLSAVVALDRTRDVFPWVRLSLTTVFAVLVLAFGTVALFSLHRRGHGRAAVALAAAVVLVSSLAAPYVARRYDAHRVDAHMPFEDLSVALRPRDDPVDVAGFCEIYALYGPKLDRRVEYSTGQDSGIDHPLFTTFPEWIASLRAHRIRAVVIGSDNCYEGLYLPYAAWLRQNPRLFQLVDGTADRGVYRFSS